MLQSMVSQRLSQDLVTEKQLQQLFWRLSVLIHAFDGKFLEGRNKPFLYSVLNRKVSVTEQLLKYCSAQIRFVGQLIIHQISVFSFSLGPRCNSLSGKPLRPQKVTPCNLSPALQCLSDGLAGEDRQSLWIFGDPGAVPELLLYLEETTQYRLPWRRKWQPIPIFLPEKSCRQRTLAGYSLWGHRVGHN